MSKAIRCTISGFYLSLEKDISSKIYYIGSENDVFSLVEIPIESFNEIRSTIVNEALPNPVIFKSIRSANSILKNINEILKNNDFNNEVHLEINKLDIKNSPRNIRVKLNTKFNKS